jgi:hypothetical protein
MIASFEHVDNRIDEALPVLRTRARFSETTAIADISTIDAEDVDLWSALRVRQYERLRP